jgi:hypothetical protein
MTLISEGFLDLKKDADVKQLLNQKALKLNVVAFLFQLLYQNTENIDIQEYQQKNFQHHKLHVTQVLLLINPSVITKIISSHLEQEEAKMEIDTSKIGIIGARKLLNITTKIGKAMNI